MRLGHSPKKCTECGKPSVPGLKKGHALCRYHFHVHMWGKQWADKLVKEENSLRSGG